MIYTIEIDGLVTIEANDPKEAIDKVKKMFEDEELTYEDLWFTA